MDDGKDLLTIGLAIMAALLILVLSTTDCDNADEATVTYKPELCEGTNPYCVKRDYPLVVTYKM